MEKKDERALVSRRRFLKTVAASGAALAVAGCSSAATPTTAPAAKKGETPKPAATAAEKPRSPQTVHLAIWDFGDADKVRTGHPWVMSLKDFEAANPWIKTTFEVSQYGWTVFAQWLAAGNPADAVIGSIAGMTQQGHSGMYALQVSVSDYMTKEDRDDYGPAVMQGVMLKPGDPNFVMGWPIEMWYSSFMGANQDILDEFNIPWKKWTKDGLSWDEWIQALQKVHDPAKNRWAYVHTKDGMPSNVWYFAEHNGLADIMDGLGYLAYGNVFNCCGPLMTETAQFILDWFTKYKIADQPHLSLNTRDEALIAVLKGEAVFSQEGGSNLRNYPAQYNEKVKKGEIAGKPVTTNVCTFPWPHGPNGTTTSIARGPVLSVFKQNPYKGDDHTHASQLLAKSLNTKEMQTKVCQWKGTWGLIPARASSQKACPQEDEQINAMVDYSMTHLRWTHPYTHPTRGKWQQDVLNPTSDLLRLNKVTAEQFEETLRKGGDQIVKTWLETEKDKTIVDYWGKIPDGYPGKFFEKWKRRTPKDAGYGTM